MLCNNGHTNPEGATFCSTCGTALRLEAGSGRQPQPTGKRSRWLPVAIGLAVLVLVAGGIVAALTLRGSDDEQATDPETDRYVAGMRALFPELEDESPKEIESRADQLCGLIRDAGSLEGFVKEASFNMAVTEQTEDLAAMGSVVELVKGMKIAMPWRCPEFEADAEEYLNSF